MPSGATYKGQPVGTFGDGALFSFQTLKPLNAFGGGVALVRERALAARVAAQVSPACRGRRETHQQR